MLYVIVALFNRVSTTCILYRGVTDFLHQGIWISEARFMHNVKTINHYFSCGPLYFFELYMFQTSTGEIYWSLNITYLGLLTLWVSLDILLYAGAPYHLYVFYITVGFGTFFSGVFLGLKPWTKKRVSESLKLRGCRVMSVIYITLVDEWEGDLVLSLGFRLLFSYILVAIIESIICKFRK